MTIKCLLCEKPSSYLDDYKFNVNSDVEFFGELKIFYCDECDLAFADPMPPLSKLDYFYKYIYRDIGRPHYTNLELLEKELHSKKNENYIDYLINFIDFKKIYDVFDYGSGTGDIGYLLSKKFKHIKLHTIESDSFSKEILKKRNFQIYEDFNNIDMKFDLIISTHVLEHLTNFDVFENFKKILISGHHMFFEVPNNLFKINFTNRPYDSPHLIFFSKKSLEKIQNKFKLKISNISYASHSIEKSFSYMRKSKAIHENWTLKKKISNKQIIKNFIKLIIPEFVIKIKRNHDAKTHLDDEKFVSGSKDSWCLRVLYKDLEN